MGRLFALHDFLEGHILIGMITSFISIILLYVSPQNLGPKPIFYSQGGLAVDVRPLSPLTPGSSNPSP